MALVQWKQISPHLSGSGVLTGSLNISGSINVNGQVVGTGKLDETTFFAYTSSNDTRVTSLEGFSSSLDATFATDAELTSISSSLAASISSISTDFDDITNKPTLVSSSAQIDLSQATGTGSFATTGSNIFNVK